MYAIVCFADTQTTIKPSLLKRKRRMSSGNSIFKLNAKQDYLHDITNRQFLKQRRSDHKVYHARPSL